MKKLLLGLLILLTGCVTTARSQTVMIHTIDKSITINFEKPGPGGVLTFTIAPVAEDKKAAYYAVSKVVGDNGFARFKSEVVKVRPEDLYNFPEVAFLLEKQADTLGKAVKQVIEGLVQRAK